MAKLYFYYGSMNSGKSMVLQAVAWNYQERDQRVVIAKPSVDTKSPEVVSRAGFSRPVDWTLSPTDSVEALFTEDQTSQDTPLCCIIIDEAQFLTAEQVNELFHIAVDKNVPVMAYGLRGDFRTSAFPGSLRLLEVAHTIGEIKTICRCGKKAIFNARLVDSVFVQEGAQVAIDGVVEYEALCGACYLSKVGDFG